MDGWGMELRQSSGGPDLVIRRSLQDDRRGPKDAVILSWA
jgi:hypothetical protein